MLDISAILVLLSAITAVAYAWFRCNRNYTMALKLPGPPSLPIIGNFLELKQREEFTVPLIFKYCAQYDGFFRLWVFHKPVVVIASPEHFQTLFTSTSSAHKPPEHYNIFHDLIGEKNVFVSNGEDWRRSRKLFISTFVQNPMNQLDSFNFAKNFIITELRKRANGETFACLKLLRQFSMTVSWGNTFGELDMDMCLSIQDKIYDIEKCMVFRTIHDVLRIPFVLKCFEFGRKYYKDLDYVHTSTKKYLSKKIAEYNDLKASSKPVPKYIFYNKMEKHANDDLNDLVREYVILWEVSAVTTPVSIGYLLILLGMYPDIQDKILNEYNAIKNQLGREPEYEHVRMFEYLDRVIKESMRIFPQFGFVFRRLKTDMKFGEHEVPKGTVVVPFHLYLCHNPDVYPDPLKFDPDRFLPENVEKRHPWAYVPFLGGARSCPGKNYAMALMKLIVPAILKEFKILPCYQNTGQVLGKVLFENLLTDSQSFPIKVIPRD